MSGVISCAVLRDLILLGEAETPAAADDLLLNCLGPFDATNRQHWNTWNAATSSLNEEDLRRLARGLVIVEERLRRWSGGSVTGAIWVYRSFERRFPQAAEALAAWMLEHSNNPWVPFGSNRGSARSLEDIRACNALKAQRRAAAEQEEAMRCDVAEARKAAKRRLAELKSKIAKVESAARADLIHELESLSVRDRLLHIALDDVHDLLFYSPDLVTEIPAGLDRTGEWALEQVRNKAAAIRKGPWHKWVQAVGTGQVRGAR